MTLRYRFQIAVGAAMVTVIAVAFIVTPRYRTLTVGGAVLRINTETGVTKVFDPDKGWIPLPDSSPAYRQGWKLVPDSTLVTDSLLAAEAAARKASASQRP